MKQRIALTLPNPLGIEATIEQAEWAESAGYDDVWFNDGSAIDSLTTAAVVAARTDRVRIGTAIVPVYTRTPAVLAATAHTLHEVSDGRFILGLGSSSHVLMENWNGQKLEKPLTRVKETAQLVRSMLKGEKSSFEGETIRSVGYRQQPLPEGAVPIYLAGLRGRMLEMAGEVGDGVILNLFPEEALPKMMKHIGIGVARGGRRLEDTEIVCRHQVIVTEDREQAREIFRRSFTPYYATPVYNNFLTWAGLGDVADAIAEGFAQKDRAKTACAMSDALVDSIAIIGDAEECRDKIRRYAEAGITTHIISCPSPRDMHATHEAFSREEFDLEEADVQLEETMA